MKSVLVSAGIVAAAPGYEYTPPSLPPLPDVVDPPKYDYDGGAVIPDVVDPPKYDYGGGAVIPDVVDPPKYDYGGGAVVPTDVPSYGGGAVIPTDVYDDGYGDVDPTGVPSYGGSDVVPDWTDPKYGYGDGGVVVPTGVYPTPTFPYGDDDIIDDDFDWGYPFPTGTVVPTDVYDKCDDYDDDDYEDCVIDDDYAPTCVPVTETEVVSETVGYPSTTCVTEAVEETYIAGVSTTCVSETVYETDYCETVTVTEVYPSETKTYHAGVVTADPYVVTDYEFVYDVTYIHPTISETVTVTVAPDDVTDVKYSTYTVTIDTTVTDVKYTTETVKETPTVTETYYEGCTTEAVYDTYIPPPVVSTVTKTIHVPKGCVIDDQVCSDYVVPTDVYGYGTDAVIPTDVYGDNGYGTDAVIPTDVYGDWGYGTDAVVPTDVPSYGGSAVIPDVTDPKYSYDDSAVVPDVTDPKYSYDDSAVVPDTSSPYDWSAPDYVKPSY